MKKKVNYENALESRGEECHYIMHNKICDVAHDFSIASFPLLSAFLSRNLFVPLKVQNLYIDLNLEIIVKTEANHF